MSLDLLKRGEKPAGPVGDLTAAEHDANLTAIENEVNAKASLGHTHTSAEVTGTFGNDRLADMLEGTIKGRAAGGGTGDPEDLTAEQVLEILGGGFGGLSLPAVDTTALVHDPDNDTKQMRIDVGAVSGATTRVITMGDRNVDLAAGGTFAELSHTHELADITDAGALAGQDDITASQISDATADGLAILTSADANSFTDAEQTKLAGVEAGATADQTNAEIETAYNVQVAAASQAEAEAGTEAAIRRFSPLRMKQAINALGGKNPDAEAAEHRALIERAYLMAQAV